MILISMFSTGIFIMHSWVVAIVANWDTPPVFVKTTGDLSQPRNSPVCNSIVFTLFKKNMVSSVGNFLNRSCPQFASTTTTTTACMYRYIVACWNVAVMRVLERRGLVLLAGVLLQ